MKKILLLLCMFLFTGCGMSSSKMEVKLEGNPTTGYSWNYKIQDATVLKNVEEDYVQDENDNMVGVGGVYIFDFEALKEGTTKITFNYSRSWEQENIYEIIYEVSVDKNNKITIVSKNGTYSENEIPDPIIK